MNKTAAIKKVIKKIENSNKNTKQNPQTPSGDIKNAKEQVQINNVNFCRFV